jgi:lipopolysaccharide/colanic/teichoic acid biosynthesis glycosyltransferase
MKSKSLYRSFIKVILDTLFSLAALLFALPLIILILPSIAVSNRGPVFFTQERSGYKGRSFRLIKIKTMNDRRDNKGSLLPDSDRLTPVGKFIRSLSLDELPQLLNVLKGDMSIVGPRPLLTDYLSLYSDRQARRHDVKPGITGWAQVKGRNSISWEEKFEQDVWYVDNVSFLLDIKILLKTILVVLKRTGISSANSATMERFRGSKNV